ncbi:MAG: DUF6599 family protein [Bacteroidales bacterium]
MFKTVLVLFLIHLFIQSHAQHDMTILLPGENPIGNWLVIDSSEVFTGDDLFYLLNGGADVYLEYGFRQVAVARYKNPEANKIHVEIYEMEDAEGAYGIFSLNSLSTGKKQDIGDLSFLYDHYVDTWKGNYFIRCQVSRKDPGIADTLLFFARTVDQKIESSSKVPQMVHLIEFDEIDLHQVRYIRGQIALSNIFNFGHGSIAAFDEGVTGRFNGNALFIFAYKDEWNRREWFASANGKMQMSRFFSDFEFVENGFTVKDRTGNPLSFKPYKQFIMVVKGFGWEEAKSYFDKIITNVNWVYSD